MAKKRSTFNAPPLRVVQWPDTYQVWRENDRGHKDLVATCDRAKAYRLFENLHQSGVAASVVYIGGQKTTGSETSRKIEV